MQVLYESSSAIGRKSTSIDGSLTREDALNLLLSGTDLKVQYIRPDAITLALRTVSTDRPPANPLATADLSLGTLQVRANSEGDDSGALRVTAKSYRPTFKGRCRGISEPAAAATG